MFILFSLPLPCPALPCPAPRKGYSCEQNKQFRLEKMYLHMCIWSRLYRIVGLSLCEMLKTHVESFPSVNCFLFLLHTHTHTHAHIHIARVMLRAHFCCLLLCAAKIVRHLEHVLAACVCGGVCVRHSCNKKKHKIKWQRQKCFKKMYMSIICNRQKK